MTESWREELDRRLDMTCQTLAGTLDRSLRQDLVAPQQMLAIWRNTQAIPNDVVRTEQIAAVARQHGFTQHRVLLRGRGGSWVTLVGDRAMRAAPLDPVLAQSSLRGSVVMGPIEQIGSRRARALLYAGAIDEYDSEVIVEAVWEIAPERLMGGMTPAQWPDLEQVAWGVRQRSGEEIFHIEAGGLEDERVTIDVSVEPWFTWQLLAEPQRSWYSAEGQIRRLIWLVGGLALALTVGFLLHIEYKNKVVVGLANRSLESAALIETILDGSEAYSIIATDLNGTIVRANHGTVRLYGHSPRALLGKPISTLNHPQAPTSDRLEQILRVTLESRRYDDVVLARRSDGSMVHVQLSSAVRTDAEGHPIGFVLITHDVTALLDRTVRLEQLNAQLAEQSRIARRANRLVNEFLANMSHELRTPLNAILGYARLVKRKTQDQIDERQTENLQRIMDAGENLLALINDLLDLSKIEAGRMPIQCSPLSLQALVSDVVATVRPLAESQRDTVEVEVSPGFPQMVSDPQHLRQIVINLVANAIKFTSKGTIRIELRTGQDPETVQIIVSDTGIGIPEEQQPHIFEAFYQVDGSTTRAQGGTGLGLSIVQRLVRQLGGEIAVDSHMGEGSVFTVTLPRDVTAVEHGRIPALEIVHQADSTEVNENT